jgi:5'-nucleotidase
MALQTRFSFRRCSLNSSRSVAYLALSLVLSGCLGGGGKSQTLSEWRDRLKNLTGETDFAPARLGTAALSSTEKLITIIGTNDIHGSLESVPLADGTRLGGMAELAGSVSAIREGLRNRLGEQRSGVIVVDAGDQFQGTLLSNSTEGEILFRAMNAVGYDAVVPGNHDYDFGPIGWLEDRVTPRTVDQNPRGALLKLKGIAQFDLLSANTYQVATLQDVDGSAVAVESKNCKPIRSNQAIKWADAKRPDFLKPYRVVTTAENVRVALVGLDHPDTAAVTTKENVRDLCFRSEADTYLEVQKELQGQADLFVIVIHNGDPVTSSLVTEIQARGGVVHAVVAGHTHRVERNLVQGVPIIQSGANGKLYGRVDLIYDFSARTVRVDPARVFAGIGIRTQGCDKNAEGQFCTADRLVDATSGVETIGPTLLESGNQVVANPQVVQMIQDARAQFAPLGDRVVGEALADLKPNRTSESALANLLTDALREIGGAEIAWMNTGGIRTSLPKGPIKYSQFFEVLPFNNRAVVLENFPLSKVIALLQNSIKTCGRYGALMQSGLRVRFRRNCPAQVVGGPAAPDVDPAASLIRVETLTGEVLFNAEDPNFVAPARVFRVATLDFLAAGGSNYVEFVGTPVSQDLGVVRELMVDSFLKTQPRWSNQVDSRFAEIR